MLPRGELASSQRHAPPKRRFAHPVCGINLYHVPPYQIFIRGHANDPLAAALDACRAAGATRRDFRTLGVTRELGAPSSSKNYEVWATPSHHAQIEGKRHWRAPTTCLGPHASGEGLNEATSVKCTPPALRKASVHELLEALAAPGQESYPPTKESETSLGFSGMGGRSAGVCIQFARRSWLRVGSPRDYHHPGSVGKPT